MEILNAFLAETYQIGDEEIASLYEDDKTTFKPDAVQKLKEFDINRISKLRGDVDKIKNDQYQKGFSEGAGKSEKIIADKFGFKSEKKGPEFFDEFTEFFKSQSGGSKEITDDDVRKHRAYLDDREKFNKEWEEKYTGLKTEHDTFKSGVEREKSFSKVREKADVLLQGFKPILPKDAEKAKNQLGWFVKDLSETNYREDGDKIIVLDKDGNDLSDGHGNRIPFDKYVRSIADKYFDYYAADKRSSSGNGGDDQGKGNDGSEDFTPPTTEQEFQALMTKFAGNGKMQAAVSKSWREFKQSKSS